VRLTEPLPRVRQVDSEAVSVYVDLINLHEGATITMSYDDRSVKPMSASLMRARIATKLLAGLYEDVPTMLTSAIRLMVELPGGSASGVRRIRSPSALARPGAAV
jgi:hypothetical protein